MLGNSQDRQAPLEPHPGILEPSLGSPKRSSSKDHLPTHVLRLGLLACNQLPLSVQRRVLPRPEMLTHVGLPTGGLPQRPPGSSELVSRLP